MTLFENMENWEVFCKDNRNKKAEGGSNKRDNYKEVLKRLKRIK
jgi:hypothetical protein